jgi:8-oxo-dGTP diphosphatase
MKEIPLLTVDCVIFNKNSVVLIRRKFNPFKGWYALPGGFVDKNESVENACSRELKEETGLEIKSKSLQLVGVYSNPKRDPRRHTVSVAFFGQIDTSKMQAGDDASSVELVKDWKNKNIAFDHMQIIKDALRLKKKQK